MIATETQTLLKDPICGTLLDEKTAAHAERDGHTFYFCSEACLKKFLIIPLGPMPVVQPQIKVMEYPRKITRSPSR